MSETTIPDIAEVVRDLWLAEARRRLDIPPFITQIERANMLERLCRPDREVAEQEDDWPIFVGTTFCF